MTSAHISSTQRLALPTNSLDAEIVCYGSDPASGFVLYDIRIQNNSPEPQFFDLEIEVRHPAVSGGKAPPPDVLTDSSVTAYQGQIAIMACSFEPDANVKLGAEVAKG